MEKKILLTLACKVSVLCDEAIVTDMGTYVQVTFVLETRGYTSGEFRVFDHRPETLQAVRAQGENFEPWHINQAFRQPAKVQVVKKGKWEYINLYPTNEEPQALLRRLVLSSGPNTWYEVLKDESRWSYRLRYSSKTGRHRRVIIFTITQKGHPFVFKTGRSGRGEKFFILTDDLKKDVGEEEVEELGIRTQPPTLADLFGQEED